MNEVNQILFCMLRDSSTPLTCFCENYIMPESNVNEVNPILFASAVSPPAPMTFFFCENCVVHESQHKKMNPTSFCVYSKPTLTYNLFYVKIAWLVSQM